MTARRTLTAVAGLLLAGCATVSEPPPGPGNPLFAAADPAVLIVDDKVWLYPTGDSSLFVWTEDEAGKWSARGELISQSRIGWIDDDGADRHYLWAPHIVAANGRYYLYYSVGPQDPTPSRIGVAVGDRPKGPFTDSGRPLLTGGKGFEAIDPMVFRDPKSGQWLLYAGGSNGAKLRVFELAPALTRIAREVAVEQPPNFVEAPFMHERQGVYYLSYSSGSWGYATYSVHYATASSPTGPWRYRGAILTSDARHKGPGHHSFFDDPETGAPMIAYHRWEGRRGRGPYEGNRWIALDRVEYLPDGAIAPIRMTGRGKIP